MSSAANNDKKNYLEAYEIIKFLVKGLSAFSKEKFSSLLKTLPTNLGCLSKLKDEYQSEKLIETFKLAQEALALGVHISSDNKNSEKESSKKEGPVNSGKKWRPEDEMQLVKEFKEELSIKDIANNLQRTEGAVVSKLVYFKLVIRHEDGSYTYKDGTKISVPKSRIIPKRKLGIENENKIKTRPKYILH